MKSVKTGRNIFKIEVTNISPHGIWLYYQSKEYFMPFDEYPWFKNQKVEDIFNVKIYHENHLHWPSLDIDIELKSLIEPERYPLKYAG
jgi:hypothetical protein